MMVVHSRTPTKYAMALNITTVHSPRMYSTKKKHAIGLAETKQCSSQIAMKAMWVIHRVGAMGPDTSAFRCMNDCIIS